MNKKILSFFLLSCLGFSSLRAQERYDSRKSSEIKDQSTFKVDGIEIDKQLYAVQSCNTNTTICVDGVAGPFNFVAGTRTFNPVGCGTGLAGGSGFGYILLNIATTGPLNLLVDGSNSTGFIDFIIYNVPSGVSPCDAITDSANEIACNYASASVGCTQFGNSFPCDSSFPAPVVTAGSQIMIIVHDYSSQSPSFTIQLGPGAQTNPPSAVINSLPPMCQNASPVQLTAETNGGTWSGTGVSASGIFNPAVAGVGTHTISYSIGVAPCVSTAASTFQVIGAPVATATSNAASLCFGENLELQGTAVANATYQWTGPGGWTSNQLNPTRLIENNSGNGTYTFTTTLANGCQDSAAVILNINDTAPPTVITKDLTIFLDSLGNATITASDIDNGSSDNCGIDTWVLDTTSFDCSDLGPNTVTLTAADSSGNTSSGTAVVTVVDTVNPIVTTQDFTVQLDASGNATIAVSDIDNGSSDNCAIATLALDAVSFDCTNLGPNTLTLTATDSSGNTSSGTAIVTVVDAVNPIVTTQDFTVQLDASGNATITASDIDNGSSDNCAIATLALDAVSFDCTNLGPNTVTLTATDSSGNTSTGTAIVTVVDAVNPIVVTQDITVYLDASGTATITASDIDNGSSDNCAIATLALDAVSFDCTNLGPNTVTLTATDSSGNTSSGTAVVTVVNNLAPTIVTQDITVQLNPAGTATIVSNDIVLSAGSNCGVQSVVLDVTDFDCTIIGANTVTVTVTDNNGNTSTATAIVTVEDTVNPVVITQDFTVQLDASGNATIAVSDIDNGSSDNCGIDTLVLDAVFFDCSNLGPNTVTLTASDSSGNTSIGTAIITVVDSLGPVITSQPAVLNLDADGIATLTVQDVVVNVTDNCGVASTQINETDFDCSTIGNNTVVITSIDINGNTSQQSVSVSVQDNIPPVAIAQDIQVSLTQNGIFTLTPSMIDNGSSDNCSIASMSVNITNFSCNQIGENTVVLTVTDTSGNINTATAIVTVLPIPEPTVSILTQEFCAIDEPIVSDIAIDDTLVQWFGNATGGNPLSNTAALNTGTYYVATKYGNCYSSRVAVNVIVKDPPAPTGDALQYICREQPYTIASLATNEEEILWYDSPSGGTPLNGSTVLEHQQKYYASQIIGDCESINRLEVEVEVRYCDVVIYNSVSANGDGQNDYFKIEGISYFPDNTVEIFNQWGQIVYRTSQYGEASGNYFKGIANSGIGISGAGQTLLPFGTYYYVIQFLNHDKQRVQKTGYLHLNH